MEHENGHLCYECVDICLILKINLKTLKSKTIWTKGKVMENGHYRFCEGLIYAEINYLFTVTWTYVFVREFAERTCC